MTPAERRRSRRLELRTTPEERNLIDRAVAASDSDLTEFVVTHAVQAAQRVLADRDGLSSSLRRSRGGRRSTLAPPMICLGFALWWRGHRRSPMTSRYWAPESLTSGHDVSGFSCRSIEQTTWLRRHAQQSTGAGTTKVFVVTEAGSVLAPTRVVAYYGWCMAQVSIAAAPERLRKGAERYPQPVALLARLGVDTAHVGRGLGAALLQGVFARLYELSDDIGCRGLLVHAESADALECYRHLVPEFETGPTDPLQLVLLMKDIRRTLRP